MTAKMAVEFGCVDLLSQLRLIRILKLTWMKKALGKGFKYLMYQ